MASEQTMNAADLVAFARADRIAEITLAHSTNDKGEFLANVHENVAFQEIYDYHGTEKMKRRLHRKMEAVSAGYPAATHLFQRVYYTKGLNLADETELRNAFTAENVQHNQMSNIAKGAMFLGYWPVAFQMSRHASPATWGLCTIGYLAAYGYGMKPFLLSRLQNNLNAHAAPFAEKYGLTTK